MDSLEFSRKKFGNGLESPTVIGWCICLIPYFKVPYKAFQKKQPSYFVLDIHICIKLYYDIQNSMRTHTRAHVRLTAEIRVL